MINLNEDTRLMLKAAEGDREAFEKVYLKYFPIVTSFVKSLDGNINSSEDLAQKVFTRMWEKRIRFKAHSSVKTYLFAVARNVFSEYLRREDKETTARNLCFLKQDTRFSNHSRIRNKSYETEIIEKVNKALAHLTPKQFQAVEYLYYMNLPSDKAGKLANCTEKAFEKRLSRAHKRLRQVLSSID